MADPIIILIDNLRETFKSIEKFLLLGLTASLVLIVLAITDRNLSGQQKVMFANINAPAFLVALVAMGTYFASGAFAAFYFVARNRIVKRLLEHDPKIVDAVLTFPSLMSRIDVPQIIAIACVGGAGIVALLLFYPSAQEMQKGLLAAGVIGSPYIVLLAMVFVAAVRERGRRDGIPRWPY